MKSTYQERLATFKDWPHTSPSPELLAAAGFEHIKEATSRFRRITLPKDQVGCQECDLAMCDWEPDDNPFKEHKDHFNCPFFDDIITSLKQAHQAITAKRITYIRGHMFDSEERRQYDKELEMLGAEEADEEAVIEAKEAAAVAQKAMEEEAAAAAAAAIEAAKPEATAKDVGFFDPTMTLDLPEFQISATSASFLHHLADVTADYKEKSVLKALKTSLRGPAFKWLKDQPKFTSLDDFKTAISKAFPPAPAAPEPAASTNQAIINPSPPQYHRCAQCSMEFSSISRLLNHTQKDCTKITCRHCELGFSSNNKLHEHVRLHHSQKAAKPPATPRLLISSPKLMRQLNTAPLTPPSTPGSMPAIPKPSPHSITMVKAPVACPPSPPPTPPRTPILLHQEQHTTPKAYMTMDELFAMFEGNEKQSRKSLDTIQKRIRSPMLRQAQAGQPNPTSANSLKSSTSTSCPSPALRPRLPANRAAGTPQYQHIAPDETSNLENQPKAKIQAPRQKYLVDADVTHTNLGIRVETTLTQAGEYELVKASAKSSKSPKPSKKLKSSISTSRPNSAPRACSPANRSAGTPQIALDAKSPRSLKSTVLTSCSSSALRPYQPANQALVTPQLADLLQAMINANIKQLAWLLRLRALVSAAPQQWYLAAAAAPIGT